MTNFDRIKSMNIEEMAEFIYSANDKICFDNCKKATSSKYSCKFGEDVTTENCMRCMKEYIERESDTE